MSRVPASSSVSFLVSSLAPAFELAVCAFFSVVLKLARAASSVNEYLSELGWEGRGQKSYPYLRMREPSRAFR